MASRTRISQGQRVFFFFFGRGGGGLKDLKSKIRECYGSVEASKQTKIHEINREQESGSILEEI